MAGPPAAPQPKLDNADLNATMRYLLENFWRSERMQDAAAERDNAAKQAAGEDSTAITVAKATSSVVKEPVWADAVELIWAAVVARKKDLASSLEARRASTDFPLWMTSSKRRVKLSSLPR